MREKKYFFGVLKFTDGIRMRNRILDPLFRDNRGSGSGTQTKSFIKDDPYQMSRIRNTAAKKGFVYLTK
jgi:hypothetical protein